ncbi:Pentatricopeptide repeat-containing protein, chloroplastic [Galdieria sulphuraria]|nr:Pentatricopeptide repeat-containing protein, chloroplastic [Galdieria sulphuraria]
MALISDRLEKLGFLCIPFRTCALITINSHMSCHYCRDHCQHSGPRWQQKKAPQLCRRHFLFFNNQSKKEKKHSFSIYSTASSQPKNESESLESSDKPLRLPIKRLKKADTLQDSESRGYVVISSKERKILELIKNSKPQEAYNLFLRYAKLVITVPTMNQLLQKLGNCRKGVEMWDVYEKARSRGILPSILTFTILLSRIGSIPRDNQQVVVHTLHQQLLKEKDQLEMDIRTLNSLMYAYCQLGKVESAFEVFRNLKRDFDMFPNEVSCNILCKGLIQASRFSEALELFSVEMPAMGVLPSVTSYAIIFEAFGRLGKLDQMSQLWKQMLQRGHQPTEAVYFSAMYACAIHGDLTSMFEYFRKMVEDGIHPNIRMYGMIIDALGKAGKLELAFSWLQKMTEEGIAPNDYIYTSLIYACGNVGDMELAMNVYESMRRSGISGNIVTLSTLLHGYCKNKYPLEALNIFHKMCRTGYRLSKSQFHELFYCLGQFRMISETLQVFETLVKQRLSCTTDDLYDILWNMSFAGNDNLSILVYQKLEENEAFVVQSDALYLYSQRNEPKVALHWGLSRLKKMRTHTHVYVAEFYHTLLYIASLCGDEKCFFSLLDEMIENQLANTRTLTILICGIAQMMMSMHQLVEANTCSHILDVGIICCDSLFHSAMDEFFCLPLSSYPKDSKEPYPEQLPWQLLDRLQPLWKDAVQSPLISSSCQPLLSIFDICDSQKIAIDRLAYNATFWSLTYTCPFDIVENFYKRMERDGVGSNLWTFTILASWKLSQENPPIEKVMEWMNQVPDGIELYNILLSFYRRQGELDKMLQVFREVRSKVSMDRITYQLLVEACFEQGDRVKALAALRHMKEAQIQLVGSQWKHLSEVSLQIESEQMEQQRCYLEHLHMLCQSTCVQNDTNQNRLCFP